MSRRVYLHVGTPKSGTSYLQDKLALNRPLLAEQGLDYVETRSGNHFEAALDLIGETWAGEEQTARGQWDALVLEAGKARGDLLVSHEILSAAGPGSVARAIRSFPGREVHVVVTARDLGRQIPAEWQERVKHRGRRDYAGFLQALQRNYTRTDWQMWFWRVQHVPRILATWGADLPACQVHLVTVPPRGAPRDLLWKRFATVVGLDLQASYAESKTTNASLGGAEVTMLRRLNIELAGREVPRETYVTWVRETIVKQVLAVRPDMRPATLPPSGRSAVEAITMRWIEQIEASGAVVTGDLAELVPDWREDDEHWSAPDDADPHVVAEAAIEALAHVLSQLEPGVAEAEAGPVGPVARLTRRLRG